MNSGQAVPDGNNLVAITGATGFVGKALYSDLQCKRFSIRRIVRNIHNEDVNSNYSVAVGDIGIDTEWIDALTGSNIVVHCASHVHRMHDQRLTKLDDRYAQVNNHGTIHLARCAARAGVRRFVFLSSVKVLGERTCIGQFYDHCTKPHPQDPYGRSKKMAEQGLWQIAQETGLEVVIIRPPLVYGPGVKANFRQLLNWVAKGIPLPLADISNLRSLVYLGNLVDLITVCIDHPNAPGNTFMVSDGHDLSTPDLIRQIAAAMGRSPRMFGMPEPLLRQAARLAGRLPQFERLTQNLQVDIEHTRSVLGWTPPYTVEQGMRETVDAFLQS